MDKISLKNLTLQELADLYDRSTEEEKQWMHDNIHSSFDQESIRA